MNVPDGLVDAFMQADREVKDAAANLGAAQDRLQLAGQRKAQFANEIINGLADMWTIKQAEADAQAMADKTGEPQIIEEPDEPLGVVRASGPVLMP